MKINMDSLAPHRGRDVVFSNGEIDELAAELLSASNEAEFDHFLGGLIRRAGSVLKKVVNNPLMKKVGGVLKGVAKKYLPQVASTLGRVAGGALGAAAGAIPGVGPVIAPFASNLGRQAGGALGGMAGRWLSDRLEFESLEQEELEYEVARQFVRVAADAVRNATQASPSTPVDVAARTAVGDALSKHAPGLLGGHHGATSGRWHRRGTTLVLHGV